MKRNWASELRAIAEGRLMLNVRNGVTVSRSMLAMIADELDAERAAHAETKRELADYQRDTSTVDAHETVNVSDKPEGQPEPVVDTEPWGYWVKHKYAEGGLVRTPCFIPEESHYTEVLPLYTSPPTSELEAERARLEARLAEAKRERDEALKSLEQIAAIEPISNCDAGSMARSRMRDIARYSIARRQK